MSNTTPKLISFAAINSYVERKIVLPTESVPRGRDMVEWGDGNKYPDYLLGLYNSVPTLRAVINGNVDYIAGDDASIIPLDDAYEENVINRSGETVSDQIRALALDYETYGGFALQVIRNLAGEVCELYHLDMRFLRMNKDCNVFYYSEEWDRSRSSVITYPAFMPSLDWGNLDEDARERQLSSVLFVKSSHTQVYPAPLYAAAVRACEIERSIDRYHLNSIDNSFVVSAIVNFNNGVPTDTVRAEIEQSFNEKMCGSENGGRVMFSWNPNKESATTVDFPKVEDFGARYDALEKRSRQAIFTAFRANPNLFGIPTEDNGFANEQYEESFRLYNRTQIRPVQRIICDAYDRAYGRKGVLTIKPFTLDGADTNVD